MYMNQWLSRVREPSSSFLILLIRQRPGPAHERTSVQNTQNHGAGPSGNHHFIHHRVITHHTTLEMGIKPPTLIPDIWL